MRFKTFSTLFLFTVLTALPALCAEIDNSYDTDTYYRMGIPKIIKRLDDYETIGDIFYKMAIETGKKKIEKLTHAEKCMDISKVTCFEFERRVRSETTKRK
jgi:hypothetical protein